MGNRLKRSLFYLLAIIVFSVTTNAKADDEIGFESWPKENKIELVSNFYTKLPIDLNNLTPAIKLIRTLNSNSFPTNAILDSSPSIYDPNSKEYFLHSTVDKINADLISDLMRRYNFQKDESNNNAIVEAGKVIKSTGDLTMVGGAVVGQPEIVVAGFLLKSGGSLIENYSNLAWYQGKALLEIKYKDKDPELVNYYLTPEERVLISEMRTQAIKGYVRAVYDNPGYLDGFNEFLKEERLPQLPKKHGGEADFEKVFTKWAIELENNPGGFSRIKNAALSDSPFATSLRTITENAEEANRIKEEINRIKTLEMVEGNQKALKELRKQYKSIVKKIEKSTEEIEKHISEEIDKLRAEKRQPDDKPEDLKKQTYEEDLRNASEVLLNVSQILNNLAPFFDYKTGSVVSAAGVMAEGAGTMLAGVAAHNPWICFSGFTRLIGGLSQMINAFEEGKGPSFQEATLDLLQSITLKQDVIANNISLGFSDLKLDILDLKISTQMGFDALHEEMFRLKADMESEFYIIKQGMASANETLQKILFAIYSGNYDVKESLKEIKYQLSNTLSEVLLTRLSILDGISDLHLKANYPIEKIKLSIQTLKEAFRDPNVVNLGRSKLSDPANDEYQANNPAQLFKELTECAAIGACDGSINGALFKKWKIPYEPRPEDGGNETSCNTYTLVLQNTSDINKSNGILSYYPEIFGYIKKIGEINKQNAADKQAKSEKPIAFETGNYPNLTLWSDAAGAYLDLLNYTGVNFDPNVTSARESQISSIMSVAGGIDQFFRDTKNEDFVKAITSAYKKKSLMILKELEKYIPNREGSKWKGSWFSEKLKEGAKLVDASIVTEGCRLEQKLPRSLIKNERLQIAMALGLIQPTIYIDVDYEKADVSTGEADVDEWKKFVKYTVNYNLALSNPDWKLTDKTSETFYLYDFGTMSGCEILAKYVWGDNTELLGQLEEELNSTNETLKTIYENLDRLDNLNIELETEKEFSANKLPEKAVPGEIWDYPVAIDLGVLGEIGIGRKRLINKEEVEAAQKYNETVGKINENTKAEISRQNKRSKDIKTEALRANAKVAKLQLVKLRTLLGTERIAIKSGLIGIKGVHDALENKIEKYFTDNEKNVNEFLDKIDSRIKSFIITEKIASEMGLQEDLCDLDLIYLFMKRILDISYSYELRQDDKLSNIVDSLMISPDVIAYIKRWRDSKDLFSAGISTLEDKSDNIVNTQEILLNSANEYTKSTQAQKRPPTGQFVYDQISSILALFDGNPNNDSYFVDNKKEPIEPLIEYDTADIYEKKFNAIYDSERATRKISLTNTRNILDVEFTKGDTRLVSDLSTCMLLNTDNIADLDLKKLGAEYFLKCNPTLELIKEVFNKQTSDEAKVDIINNLFTSDFFDPTKLGRMQGHYTFAEEIAHNLEENVKVRLAAIYYLAKEGQVDLATLDLESYGFKDLPKYIVNLIRTGGVSLTIDCDSLGESVQVTNPCSYDFRTLFSDFSDYLTNLVTLDTSQVLIDEIPETILSLSKLENISLGLYRWFESLPECIGKLTKLKSLHLYNDSLTELPESIGNLTSLVTLDLGVNSLKKLPKSIGNLTELKELHFYSDSYGDSLTELPESIGNLTSLVTLNLEVNSLEKLPDSIGKLTELKDIHLYSRRLTELPDSIGKLTGLKDLHLYSERLTELPESIGNLTSLVTLNLKVNSLEKLPDSIGKLTELKDIHLYSERLTELPESIGSLKSLVTLYLGVDSLRKMPDSIGNLTKLEDLTLHIDSVTELPETIGNLTNLITLSLGEKSLKRLPDSIGNLTELKDLHLYIGSLTELPESIGNLASLVTLDLGGNSLKRLPDSIGNLTKLEDLTLYIDSVTELPESIGNLTELKKLNLRDNALKTLPESLVNLPNLVSLRWSGSFIWSTEPITYSNGNNQKVLPAFIGNLAKLESLTLTNLNLQALPETIGNLIALQELNLYGDNLSVLPEAIGNLVELRCLNLEGSNLKALPATIGNLIKLTHLDLTDNNIQALPETIGNLVELRSLRLRGNNLKALPETIGNIVALQGIGLEGNDQAPPVTIDDLIKLGNPVLIESMRSTLKKKLDRHRQK